MNDQYDNIRQIISALRRHLIMEKILIFIFIVFFMIMLSWNVVAFLHSDDQEPYQDASTYFTFQFIFMIAFYCINLMTIIYFLRMGQRYIRILSQYSLQKYRIYLMLTPVTLLTLISIFRPFVYEEFFYFKFEFSEGFDYHFHSFFQTPFRVMLYCQ